MSRAVGQTWGETAPEVGVCVSATDVRAGFVRRGDQAQGLKVGVLAVQGAFIEHERVLREFGATVVELRQAADITEDLDGLVLPGGESTTQHLLLDDLGMTGPLRRQVEGGLPVLATCAGMILLASEVRGGGTPCLGTIPMRVLRNAYGRQIDSFHTTAPVEGVDPVPMTFIRAPCVEEVGDGVKVLSRVDGRIVAVRYGAQVALAFHPELDGSRAIHQAFLRLVAGA